MTFLVSVSSQSIAYTNSWEEDVIEILKQFQVKNKLPKLIYLAAKFEHLPFHFIKYEKNHNIKFEYLVNNSATRLFGPFRKLKRKVNKIFLNRDPLFTV